MLELDYKFMGKDIYQRGQVLLIVVLIMVVGLTVGLSLASRSITNLRITTEEDNSQRAFSAAEAGVEQALRTNAVDTGDLPIFSNQDLSNNAKIESVHVNALEDMSEYLFNGGSVVFKDEGADLWLSDYNQDTSLIYDHPYSGTLKFYWGTGEEKSLPCTASALEIIILSGPKLSPAANRYVFDPCSGRGNSFKSASGGDTFLDKTFKYSSDEISVSVGRIAKVIPLYTNTQIGVKTVGSSPALPAQGKNISSTGKSGEDTEKIVRKINVFQGYPSLPTELFAYILFVTQ